MKNYLVLLFAILLLAGCKNKKVSLKDDEVVEVSDFIEFFPEVTLPYYVYDTTLLKKQSDSLLIGNKIFAQFASDSLLNKDFGKAVKPKLYPLARIKEKGAGIYLVAKAVHGNKRAAYLLCFNDDNKFTTAMPLVKYGFDNSTTAYGLLDKKFQITTYRERRATGAEMSYKKNVYFYNNAAESFTLILTEPNQEIIENVYNPIDTLPKKNKYAGDYIKDKKNFIAFRDGKTASDILFFVHFEKDKGDCIGELKGAARFISPTKVQYKEPGNPCTVEFTFTAAAVTMKEIEGCGSYRDIKCFFEGSYPKKKTPKPVETKKKKKK